MVRGMRMWDFIDGWIRAHPNISGLFLGGFFGGTVKVMLEPTPSFLAWLVSAFIGICMAIYIGGAVNEYMGFKEAVANGVGFGIALAGSDAARTVQRHIAKVLKKQGNDV